MESLLHSLGHPLRLRVITIETLLSFEAATSSGFGLFFGVSFGGGHGAFLCSVGALPGEVCTSSRDKSHTCTSARAGLLLALRFPHFLLSFASALRYKGATTVPTLPALYPGSLTAGGGSAMTFEELLDQAIALLQRRVRLTHQALKRQFNLDDDYLEDLKAELIQGQRLAVDEEGQVLVWTGETPDRAAPAHPTEQTTPQPLLHAGQTGQRESPRSAPQPPDAERRQLTVLFC